MYLRQRVTLLLVALALLLGGVWAYYTKLTYPQYRFDHNVSATGRIEGFSVVCDKIEAGFHEDSAHTGLILEVQNTSRPLHELTFDEAITMLPQFKLASNDQHSALSGQLRNGCYVSLLFHQKRLVRCTVIDLRFSKLHSSQNISVSLREKGEIDLPMNKETLLKYFGKPVEVNRRSQLADF